MMDELNGRLNEREKSSNVELTKLNTHSNSVELDPLTGTTNRSDYSHKLNERVQSDVEKLKDGSIHRHRYKLHESNENKTNSNQSTSLGNEKLAPISSRLTSDLPSSSRLSRLPYDGSSSRLRHHLDDEDLFSDNRTRSKTRDYEPIGARLASDLGIEVRDKPISFNYECDAKRRAHNLLLKEINDEDEKFRTLPPPDQHRYKAREQMFANDWNPTELRYLSKEARHDLIRPTRPFVPPEQPFKHKRKSLYAKYMESI